MEPSSGKVYQLCTVPSVRICAGEFQQSIYLIPLYKKIIPGLPACPHCPDCGCYCLVMADVRYTFRQGPSAEISEPDPREDLLVVERVRDATAKGKPGYSGGGVVPWEVRLMRRLIGSVKGYVSEITGDIKVPAEFLAALTANESGGDPHATRFEPGVYQHLKNVAEGRVTSYGNIGKSLLEREIGQHHQPVVAPTAVAPTAVAHAAVAPTAGAPTAVHPETTTEPHSGEPKMSLPAAKPDSYHAEHLTVAFSTACAPALSALEDEAIRHLATSWGLTQIMGYHMLGRPEPVEKLSDPVFHYRLAARMVEDFAARFHLDPQRDFEPLFHCWNTGRPDGKTFDPSYAEKGMRRIEICRQLTAAPPAQAPGAGPSAPAR